LFHVYVADTPVTDLLILGNFTIGLKGGKYINLDFTARFVAKPVESEQKARLRFVQVWTDSSKMQEAISKAFTDLAVTS
jgi:hypothetical protein